MRKKVVTVLAAGLLILGLTGCGENQIPELTDEQMQLMGEYTAITLMKYDANQRSRLVDYTQLMPTPEPEATPEPEHQEPTGMDPVDDTPVVGGPAGGDAAGAYAMEDVLELPEGMSVLYMGEALCHSYPEGDANSFAVTASEGRQLLVLNFTIVNASGQEQTVDFLSLSPEFRLTVNGDYTRRTLPSILEDDLSVFEGTIPDMGSVPTVLVIEVDDKTAENLSSISLYLKNESKTCTIQLL